MNKIYLFAIATILATAGLMAGTFTIASFAQNSSTPSGESNSTVDTGAASNATGGNATASNTTPGGY